MLKYLKMFFKIIKYNSFTIRNYNDIDKNLEKLFKENLLSEITFLLWWDPSRIEVYNNSYKLAKFFSKHTKYWLKDPKEFNWGFVCVLELNKDLNKEDWFDCYLLSKIL